jgi:hypothetical protein
VLIEAMITDLCISYPNLGAAASAVFFQFVEKGRGEGKPLPCPGKENILT